MRILFLSHGYPPVISGVTLVVQKVAREMVRRGHQVTVVTASDRDTPYQDQDEGVALIRVRSAPNPFWSEGRLPLVSYNRLKEIITAFQPHVINTHDSGLLGVYLHRLKQERMQAPELMTCHYLPQFVSYYVPIAELIEHMLENLTWELSIRIGNGFDHIVFPTRTQQQLFIQAGLETPSSVISNGLDVRRYCPGEPNQDVENRYGLPAGPRILVVGRLAKDKRIDVLIRAVSTVSATRQAHLLIVGRGDDRERLEELVEHLGAGHCVHFLGFVPEDDLPALYRSSTLFAIASDVEVQSIPTLQAAATGLPIVAANAAALPELVQDDVNGHLVPPDQPTAFADAICRILDDPELARRYGQASLEIGRRHAEEQTFDAYEALYWEYSQRSR